MTQSSYKNHTNDRIAFNANYLNGLLILWIRFVFCCFVVRIFYFLYISRLNCYFFCATFFFYISLLVIWREFVKAQNDRKHLYLSWRMFFYCAKKKIRRLPDRNEFDSLLFLSSNFFFFKKIFQYFFFATVDDVTRTHIDGSLVINACNCWSNNHDSLKKITSYFLNRTEIDRIDNVTRIYTKIISIGYNTWHFINNQSQSICNKKKTKTVQGLHVIVNR